MFGGLPRILSAADYGRFTVLQASAAIIFLAIGGWVPSATVRFMSRRDDHDGDFLIATNRFVRQGIVLTIALLGVSVGLSGNISAADAIVVALLVGPWILLLPDWHTLRARDRFQPYTLLAVGRYIISPALGILAALFRPTIIWFVSVQSLALLAMLPIAKRWRESIVSPSRSLHYKDSERALLRFALPLIPANLFINALALSDRVLIGAIIGDVEAGRYTAAYMVGSLPLQLLLAVVATALGPPLTRRWLSDRARAQYELGRLIAAASVVTALLVAGITATSAQGLSVIFGAVGNASTPKIATIVAAAETLMIVQWITQRPLGMEDMTTRIMAVSGFALVANLGANIALLPRFGPEAAAWTTLASYTMMLTGMWAAVPRDMRPSLGTSSWLITIAGLGATALTIVASA